MKKLSLIVMSTIMALSVLASFAKAEPKCAHQAKNSLFAATSVPVKAAVAETVTKPTGTTAGTGAVR